MTDMSNIIKRLSELERISHTYGTRKQILDSSSNLSSQIDDLSARIPLPSVNSYGYFSDSTNYSFIVPGPYANYTDFDDIKTSLSDISLPSGDPQLGSAPLEGYILRNVNIPLPNVNFSKGMEYDETIGGVKIITPGLYKIDTGFTNYQGEGTGTFGIFINGDFVKENQIEIHSENLPKFSFQSFTVYVNLNTDDIVSLRVNEINYILYPSGDLCHVFLSLLKVDEYQD